MKNDFKFLDWTSHIATLTAKKIITISCRFCQAFVSEKSDTRTETNKPILTVKSWNGLFRTDHMRLHMSAQHADHWEEYQSLSEAKKLKYFDVTVPYVETVIVHFWFTDERICVLISSPIVDIILNDLLASPNDPDEISECTKKSIQFDNASKCYEVTILKRKCFTIAISNIKHGLSFKAVALTLRSFRSSASLAFMENVSVADVSMYVRALAIMSLQRISNQLKSPKCWAFSIAFDGTTVILSSYINLCVHFFDGIQLRNYHFLAIPIYVNQKGAIIFEIISKFLTSFYGEE